MPKIEQEISSAAKRTFNKLKKEIGEEFILETLLNDYKKYEAAEAEIETLKSSTTTKGGASMPTSPDIITALGQTIEIYARENDRLLKIANFSEYDDKINGLKSKIEDQAEVISKLSESLKDEKKRGVDLEYDKSKLEEQVEELEASMKQEQAQVGSLAGKIAELEAAAAQRDTTITSYSTELEKYKAMVEELKAQAPAAASPEENPAYS